MLSGLVRATGTIAIASAVLACGSVGTPDLVVPLETMAQGDWELLVYDDSGLVAGARSAQLQPGIQRDDVIAFPDKRELEIGWIGGACSHRPTLEVAGDSAHLRLELRNPSDPQLLPFLPIACPAVGIPLRVTISLNQPVQQIAADVEVLY